MVEQESKRITKENKLSKQRSKYQKQRLDDNWYDKRLLEKKKRYDPVARSKLHKRAYEVINKERHRETLKGHIWLLKMQPNKQNNSNKNEVTECLLRQVRNLKGTKLNRDARSDVRNIKRKIQKVHKSIENQIDSVCKTAEIQQLSLSDTTKMFSQINWNQKWIENAKYLEMLNQPCQCNICFNKEHKDFRCKRLMRQMKDKEDKYTCPGCQELIHKQEFKGHYDKFILHGQCYAMKLTSSRKEDFN